MSVLPFKSQMSIYQHLPRSERTEARFGKRLEMLTTRRLIALVLGSWLLASGCSNHATATLSPGADLSTIKSFYVVHQPKDTHQLQNLIRDRLLSEGYKATAGPESERSSQQADSVVTYVDRWMWDMTLYLLELTITLRDANNDFPLAVGNSYHTSLTRLSSEEMVNEVITNILNAGKQTTKTAPQ
ncbi:MAG: hypothetical protein ACXW6J_15195 [Candidatus Binatia bacterium]